ncbi:hypothetical protein JWG42_05175 [Desulfoprunum benzoelyticum]|uniref:Uncharacterized protein n=1 Tax=Desulfoprunum benzoelyticum TaxID=1506996 RepID=A0A840UU25_9BACT|nr:hypothetical protein [Desulfoprunum benzoelyticum]MBB5348263.1 hypothetical protein [Desulfoprunum benzoelyticum]MBM9529544.1 hypothetical protein [Desulfoprunum benzoelyticum]
MFKEAEAVTRLIHGGEPDLVEIKTALGKLSAEVAATLTEIRQRLIEQRQAAAE